MIALNALSQLTALGGVLVLQTVYMIVVARVLGPEDFGRLSFAWAIVQMLLIGGDLGLHNTAIREISSRRDESVERSNTFFWLKGALSALLGGVVLLLSFLTADTPETQLLLLLFGAGMFFHSLAMGLNVVFQAHGKLYWGSLNIFLIFFLQFVLGISFLWQGGGLISLGLAYLLATVVALLVDAWIFEREIHPVQFRRPEDWRGFMRKSLAVGLSTFFHTVSGRVGITLLALLAGPFHTGIFSAAARIPQALSNIAVGIFSAVLPAMASYQGEAEPVRRLFQRALVLMLAISVPLAVMFFLFSRPLIALLYGEAFSDAVLPLKILCWSVIPVFVGMAFSHVLLSQNELVGRLPWVTGGALLLQVGFNLLLIGPYGPSGAALALLASEAVLMGLYAWAAREFLSQGVGLSSADLDRG